MKKSQREITALAREAGITNIHFKSGGRHMKLTGEVDGRSIKIPVSINEAFSTSRWQKCTRLNIRRAVEAARA